MSNKIGRTEASRACEAIVRHLEYIEDARAALVRLKKPGKRWSLEDIERGCDLKKHPLRDAHFMKTMDPRSRRG